jgi:hypothetical protein
MNTVLVDQPPDDVVVAQTSGANASTTDATAERPAPTPVG